MIDVVEAFENLTGISKDVKALMTRDVKKIKQALGTAAPELTIGAWFERRDEDARGLGWIKENDVGRFLGYTITFSKGVGWDAGGAHIMATTEQICTVDMKCTEGTWAGKIGNRNGTIQVTGQTNRTIEVSVNGENPVTYSRVTTRGRKYRSALNHEIRFRHNYTELQYRPDRSGSWNKKLTRAAVDQPTMAGIWVATVDGRKHVMVVDNVQSTGFNAVYDSGANTRFTRKKFRANTYEGGYQNVIRFRNNMGTLLYKPLGGDEIAMTRGSQEDLGGGIYRFHLVGDWTMKVRTRDVIERIVTHDDRRIVVRRDGLDIDRIYNRTAQNEYTGNAGDRFRFVTNGRGIWISDDNQTVFQMHRKQ